MGKKKKSARLIVVDKKTRLFLMCYFAVSDVTVRSALHFYTDSVLARSIRFEAMQQGGHYLKETNYECEEID